MKLTTRIIKRALDLNAACAGLALTLPALVGIAVAIRLDSPGPILFRQERLGKGGRRFRIAKFRTMAADAGVKMATEREVLTTENDARITRVGRLLRKASLDELPQLWNVLVGDMSLVGPRPDLPVALELYTESQRAKLSVRPGITGSSQVSGRNILSAERRWDLDAEYALNASIRKDLEILLRTVAVVVTRQGVY